MTVDWEDAAASIVAGLGDQATYEGANGDTTIEGVLSRGHQRVEGGRGPSLNSRRVVFSVLKADLGFEPQQGDQVTIDDVLHEVASIQPDEENVQWTFGLKRV